MIGDSLSIVVARSVLGFADPDELVDAGVRELTAGRDTESLRILAGLGPDEVGEARQLFERALGELGMAIFTERDAVALLSREIASQILEETVAADVGAKQIWEITLQAQDVDTSELDSFVYAASEWDDRPEDRNVFREGIYAAASELVGAPSG